VYRGVNAYCTACGQPRFPLANTSVNMAGQPSKVGGTVARVFGWLSLAFGNLLALSVLGACGAIVGFGAAAPYIISLPIALVATILGIVLLRGGRDLKQAGENTEKATRGQAIHALANMRGGVLTANDVAQAINVTPAEADAILTQIAKEQHDHVTVDVDDDGVIFYRFDAAHWRALAANPALWERPAPPKPAMAPNAPARVPPAQARVQAPARVAEGADRAVRVDARDALEEELEAMEREAAQRMR
jgi:hypothetical protein